MAVCGTIDDSVQSQTIVRDKLHEAAVRSVGTQAIVPIPFGGEKPDIKRVTIGFAAFLWVIDVYEWLRQDSVPSGISCKIIGLLHGYSGEAIAQYERHQADWRGSQIDATPPDGYPVNLQEST